MKTRLKTRSHDAICIIRFFCTVRDNLQISELERGCVQLTTSYRRALKADFRLDHNDLGMQLIEKKLRCYKRVIGAKCWMSSLCFELS